MLKPVPPPRTLCQKLMEVLVERRVASRVIKFIPLMEDPTTPIMDKKRPAEILEREDKPAKIPRMAPPQGREAALKAARVRDPSPPYPHPAKMCLDETLPALRLSIAHLLADPGYSSWHFTVQALVPGLTGPRSAWNAT